MREFLKVYSNKKGETFFFLLFVGWNLDVMAGAQAVFWEFKQLKPCAEENEAQWKDPIPWGTKPADLLSSFMWEKNAPFFGCNHFRKQASPGKVKHCIPHGSAIPRKYRRDGRMCLDTIGVAYTSIASITKDLTQS